MKPSRRLVAGWSVLIVTLSLLLIGLTGLCASGFSSFDSRFFPSARDLYASKQGRVLDADTGEPIAHAFVIAQGDAHWSGFFVNRSANPPEYRVVVESDEKGNFVIPAQPNPVWPLEFHLFTSSMDREWKLSAVVPGYVSEIDLSGFASEYASRRPYTLSTLATPKFARIDGKIVVDLKMKKFRLTLRQAVGYYLSSLDHWGQSWEKTPEENARITPALTNWMLPLMCDVPPDQRVDVETTGDLVYFWFPLEKLLREREPQGFNRTSGGWNLKYEGFLSSNICQIFKERRES